MKFELTPWMRHLAIFLVADIALSFAYAAIPTNFDYARVLLAYIQLACMAVTMWLAIKQYVLEF